MVLVFASFILGGQMIIELFGLGLAGAVLLDALIVRSILVPGLMLSSAKPTGRYHEPRPGAAAPQRRGQRQRRPGAAQIRRNAAGD